MSHGDGRDGTRPRRRAVAAVFGVLAVLAVAGVAPYLLTGPGSSAAPATGRPGLPERFADLSMRTGGITDDPPGRAIALYRYGNFDDGPSQTLVVGADADTYRQVDGTGLLRNVEDAMLLSPDGTRILASDASRNVDGLLLLDLTTGDLRELPVRPAGGVQLLAWSPDGRYVAYTVASVPRDMLGAGNAVNYHAIRHGELAILDLATGESRRYPRYTPARGASFAPDGRELAVQVGKEAVVVGLDGAERRRLPLPEWREIVSGVGWSPEGSMILTVNFAIDGPDLDGTGIDANEYYRRPQRLGFVDATGGGRPMPPDRPLLGVLGWSGPTEVVTYEPGDEYGGGTFAAVSLTDGARRKLSVFPPANTCGGESCHAYGLHLATGLLTDVAVRPAGRVDRGPWPTWMRLAASAATVTVTGVVLVFAVGWRMARDRRRRWKLARPPGPHPVASPFR